MLHRRVLFRALWIALLVVVACASPPHRQALERADALLAMGRPDEASRAYEAALVATPDQPDALRGLARARLAGSDPDPEAAVEAWERLLATTPDSVGPAETEDYCEALLRSAERALASGEAALPRALARARALEDRACPGPEVSRALAGARIEAARGARHAGQVEEALDHYASARRADPGLAVVFAEPAELLLETGRRDEAIELLSDALARHPRDPELRALMVGALGIRYSEPSLERPSGPPK